MSSIRGHDHTFARSMVAGAVERVANDPANVTEFDRLAVIVGASLEIADDNLQVSQATLTWLKSATNPGNHNGPKRLKDKIRQTAPPVFAGGGIIGIIVAVLDKL